MRDRLIYILKHNIAIQNIYRVVMSFVFKVMGLFMPTDDNLVLFVSFMGKSFNDSPKAVYDFIKQDSHYSHLKCVWAFEDPSKHPELTTVKIDTLSYFTTALRARYWVTNTNIERGLKFKKRGTRFLNTWHGIALKKMGNDCPGRKDFDFSNVDCMTVSSKYDEERVLQALNARESSFIRCGLPRNEALWHTTDVENKAMREKLGIAEGKKVVLYAPTWRDSTDGGKSYEIKPPIHFDEWKKQLGNGYVVLFRAHHQTTKILGLEFDDFIRNVSEYPTVNDLMIASDLLITDYSAIAFDYSILCKPILVFAYDFDTYLADRGTYFDMNSRYPNPVCRTEQELLEKIKKLNFEDEAKKTMKFRNYFVQYGGNATEQCVEALLGMEDIK